MSPQPERRTDVLPTTPPTVPFAPIPLRNPLTVLSSRATSKQDLEFTADHIARTLEQDIILGGLKPGTKLREAEIARRFSASRHQVREGLARLESSGLVVKERNRGVSVRRFTAREVREIYDIREILQLQAVLRINLPAAADDITRLAALNADYEAAIEEGNLQRIHEANDLFHMELFRLCGNNLLIQLIKNLMDLTYVIRSVAFGTPENIDNARRHHRIMLDLLASSDRWALAQLCIDHIQPTKVHYLAQLTEGESE